MTRVFVLLFMCSMLACCVSCSDEDALEVRRTGMEVVSLLSEEVQGVKNGYLNMCPDHTIGEVFDKFFENPHWVVDPQCNQRVIFHGYCTYMDRKCDIQFTFMVQGDDFQIESMLIDGKEQNDFIQTVFLATICEDYSD